MPFIYADNNATTAMLPEVYEAMREPALTAYGNPSSVHDAGTKAAYLLENARIETADVLGCSADEIVFTSGGTESNNIALRSHIENLLPERRHVVVAAIEHPAVLDPLLEAEKSEQITLTVVAPDDQGTCSVMAFRSALEKNTGLIACMFANNETGAIQPIAEIAKMAADVGAFFHCDTVQAAGKVPLNLHELDVSTASFSAHKFHGPNGVGALFVNKGVNMKPQMLGGGQERGVRPGTLNVMGNVGLAAALKACDERAIPSVQEISRLRDALAQGLRDAYPEAVVHCLKARRLPNTLSIAFPGKSASELVRQFSDHGVACSAGSACSANNVVKVSHVLSAMGISEELALGTLRFSVSMTTTEQDVEAIVSAAGKIFA